MANANEGFVQIAVDSSGKRIRNLQFQVLQSDGTVQTVYAQTISIVDADTGLAVPLDTIAFQQEQIRLLRTIARGIEIIAETPLLDEIDEDGAQGDAPTS